MTTLKPRPDPAQTLAAFAWAAVALTPVAVIAVMAVAAVLVSAWARSRSKRPPGADGARRE